MMSLPRCGSESAKSIAKKQQHEDETKSTQAKVNFVSLPLSSHIHITYIKRCLCISHTVAGESSVSVIFHYIPFKHNGGRLFPKQIFSSTCIDGDFLFRLSFVINTTRTTPPEKYCILRESFPKSRRAAAAAVTEQCEITKQKDLPYNKRVHSERDGEKKRESGARMLFFLRSALISSKQQLTKQMINYVLYYGVQIYF